MFQDLANLIPGGQIDPAIVLTNLVLAFILSLLIAYVYKKTHKGISYSQAFVLTLVISGVVICAVMMVIGSNIARAFGAFGAFSLIRFRTAIKDAKDMGYIFLVLAVGMAVGTDNYIIAALTTLIVLAVIVVLTKVNFGSMRKYDYILTFNFNTQDNDENLYKVIFDKYLKNSNILNIKARENGKILQLTFSIKFISESDSQKFISELQGIRGVEEVGLITAKSDVEY